MGRLVMMKLVLAALSRADQPEHQRADFHVYVDETACVASPIMAEALSELRKFHVSLILCHQYMMQLTDDILAAIRGNVGTTIAFQIGADDAEKFRYDFAPPYYTGEFGPP